MLFFNSPKKEESPIRNQPSATGARRQLAVYIPEELYNSIQMQKIKLGRTATDIVVESLALSMEFLEPKERMTAEKHKSLMDDIANAKPPEESASSYAIEEDKPLKPRASKAKSAYAIEANVSLPVVNESLGSGLRRIMSPVIKKMKSGESIVVSTQRERQVFWDVSRSLRKGTATRSIKDGEDTKFRCWII